MPGPAPLTLVLASASPRRLELLRTTGLAVEVHPVDVDETPLQGEAGAATALRLARLKAAAAAVRFPGRAVLAADTVVVADGVTLGKPAGPAEARAMLARLSGRWHEVVTGVALVVPGGRELSEAATTRVLFAALDDGEIDAYAAGHEPLDKAGAYALQGAAGWFVEALEGSASNVIGLPLATVRRLFRAGGLPAPPLDPA